MSIALPIDAVLCDLVAALRANASVVLHAPTGAGKTTRVPPALLSAIEGRILVLEPRRVAARMAARRVAQEQGCNLGTDVGYQVRFERKCSSSSRIVFMTPGILLGVLQRDPFLEGVGAIVFDEFHERSLDCDLALALARQIQQEAREDLRLVVMSATLQTESIAAWLGAAVVQSEGRLHPIDIHFSQGNGRADHRDLVERMARTIARAHDEGSGHILAFLPGVREIQRTADALASLSARVMPLHGRLPLSEQAAAVEPCAERKIVLATNVAETSLTVPGVTTVVDSGLARVMRHDVSNGLNRLELERISRASADQRAGRAGRERPGTCYRLWTQQTHQQLTPHTAAEIERVDLTTVALQLLCWGEQDLAAFGWFQAPPSLALDRALALLEALGATRDSKVNEHGRALNRLPTHPRVAAMLLAAKASDCAGAGGLAAAIVTERIVDFSRGSASVDSDVVERVRGLRDARRRGDARAAWGARIAAQLTDAVDPEGRHRRKDHDDTCLRRTLLAGWPDRVAHRREAGSDRAVMVGRRGVRLGRDSRVRNAPWFVCADVDAGRRGEHAEAWVRMASAVDVEWLEADASTGVDVAFDAASGRVEAFLRKTWFDLVLSEQRTRVPRNAATAACLVEAATERLDEALGLQREDIQMFRWRARLVREHMPEKEIPALDRDALVALLPGLCAGKRSFEELLEAPLLDHLRSTIGWQHAKALDALVPLRISLPSGRTRALKYVQDGPPVLAVKIQEMFGASETPAILGGRMPVVLHLLAPNQRPQQVTQDLASFWATGYPEVRKELRARYPRHPWPEDPLSASATWKTKRRS